MGNKHCNNYNYNHCSGDAWRSYSMEDNHINSSLACPDRRNSRRIFYNQPSLGALGKSMDRAANKRMSKAEQQRRDQPCQIGMFKRLVGAPVVKNLARSMSDNRSSSNTNTTPYNPFSQRPVMIGQSQSHSEIRRPREERKEEDNEFEAVCEFCNDTVIPEYYSDHLVHCKHNPQNATATCEYCGKDISIYSIDEHTLTCEQKVENLKMECEHCRELIPLESHHYHSTVCPYNPQAKKAKIQNREVHPQVPECAICLQEVKNDNEGMFLACAHRFHTHCIEGWAKKKKTCPVCMTDFA